MDLLHIKYKKNIGILLSATMLIGLLSGCSLKSDEASEAADETVSEVTTEGELNNQEKIVNIVQNKYEDFCELGSDYVFNPADFFTTEGIEPSELTVDRSKLDTEQSGVYDIGVTYEDAYEAVVTVTVKDTTPPELSLRSRMIYVNQVDKDTLQLGYHVEFRDIQTCEIEISEVTDYAKYGDYDVLDDISEEELVDEIEAQYMDYPFTYSSTEEDQNAEGQNAENQGAESQATENQGAESQDADKQDTLEEGIYAVGIRVVDKSGNTSCIIAAFVYDHTPAEISGLRNQTVYQDDLNAIPEVSVSSVKIVDNLDGEVNISDANVTLVTKSEANHTYTLTVAYTDKAGNVATAEAVVTVKKPEPAAPETPASGSTPAAPETPASDSTPAAPEAPSSDSAPEAPASSETPGSSSGQAADTNPETAPSTSSSDYMQRVLELVNAERAAAGLSALTLNTELCANANVRAVEISTFFSHSRPDGSDCFSAITVSYWSAGENIAAGYATPEAVVTGWMNSEGHRANILSPSFTQLGVGYYYEPGSAYSYYWVQLFIG